MKITAIAGRTVITGLSSGGGFMMTSAQKRPDRTATEELWLPVGRMLEQSMKDTCKSWLQVITACLSLSATTWGQSFELGSPGANSPSSGMHAVAEDDYGSVKLGGSKDHSASAYVKAPGVQQSQYVTQAPPMFSDSTVPVDESIGFAATRPEDRILWRVGNSSGDRYGIIDGYTNLNAFIPLAFDSDRSLWWINPRVNISDEGNGSSSIGIGHRVYIPEDDRVYGASFWWDNDTNYGENFNQLGGSFESIGRYTDLRFNFAIPIGETKSETFIGTSGTSFVGNSLSVQRLFRTEEAFSVYDAEVAVPFPGLGDFGVDFGVGVYYLGDSAKSNTVGVSARTQAQITDNFWLNGLYTNDDTFGSNFSINFELTMPASGPVRWFRQRPVSASLTDSVIRRYRMAVDSRLATRNEGTVNPKTGAAYFIAHIDPDATSTGTGTVENPFMSLEAYAAADPTLFDVIYVQPRADETDVNLNTGIDLLSGQRLLSSSVPHAFESNGEVFTVAPTVAGAPLPFLSSSGFMGDGPIVTLESGGTCFEVSGFQIDHLMTVAGPNDSSGSAIFGDMVSDVSINRNVLRNSEYATQLTNFSGSLHYRENVLRDNTVGGLQVEYTLNGQLGLFSNSTFNNMGIGFEVIADGAMVSADNVPVLVNSAPDPGAPAFSSPDGFVDSTGTTGQDTVFPFDSTTMATGIVGNFVDLNETGMLVEAINGGTIDVNVEGNVFSNNQNTFTGGFVGNAEGAGSTLTLNTFINNTAQFNVGSGVLLAATDGGTINTPLRVDPTDPEGLEMIAGFGDNTITGNVRNGIALVVEDSTVDDFVLGNNTITENGESGVAMFLDNATFSGWVIEDSIINENEEDGVTLVMLNGTTGTDFSLLNNTLSDNLGNGYNVVSEDSVLTDLIIDSNTITGNGSLGSAFNITLAFNTMTGDQGRSGVGPLTALTPAEQAVIQEAARRWEELIVGDVADVNDPMFQATFGTIDDILLFADGEDYGGSGVLGVSYGQTNMYRTTNGLPFWGVLTMVNDGTFDVGNATDRIDYFSVALHEIGHSLGFQGLSLRLNEAATGNDIFDPVTTTLFGPTALAEHNAAFGVNETFIQLQIPTGGGHWGDPRYSGEFMFPTIALGSNTVLPQSRMTVGYMQDLGYQVNLNAADPYPPTPVQTGGTASGLSQFVEVAPGTFDPADINTNALFEIDPDSTFDVAQSDAGGQNGIQIDLTNSEITNVVMTDNLIDSNLGSGFQAELRGASLMSVDTTRDVITNNGDNGMEIILRNTSASDLDVFNATITGNGQDGIRGETFNDTLLSVSVSSPDDPDFMGMTTISGNSRHGISLIASPDSPTMNNSQVDLFVDETLLDMNGQRGINLLASENSQFGNSTDPFLAPDGDPILIQNSIITNNGTDGIGTNRRGDAFINAEILNNMIMSNGGDGIQLLSQNANTIDTYLIQDNQITGNFRGIHLRVEADAVIDATINDNLIQSNSSHGIHVTDRANSALDQRNVFGLWTQNEILNNGGSGIQLDGSYGSDGILQIGLNGDDVNGDSLGNIISGNAGWGIQSTAVGIASIQNNEITNNGQGGINIDSSIAFGNIIEIDNNFIVGNTGIGIELLAENIVSLSSSITNNTIATNTGDGIELATLDLADSDVTIDTNIIFDNGGRGIDILNAGTSPDSIVNVNNNIIDENGGEGVYVVNTASVTQFNSKDGPTPGNPANYLNDPTHGMQATGGVFNDPSLVFNMDNNLIRNNGEASQFDATGFVMRVGTSDATTSPFFEGGFASDGFGGVVATITNNVMSGNFGTDVWFESFTSTVDPNTTAGTWNQNEFTIMGQYQSDPLARLDLVFTGNSGDSIDVTNTGAWYDNAEPVFKTRLSNIMAPNIAGPFPAGGPGASRRRNAQRLASRDAPFNAPVVSPDGGQYLYPGVGTSTFRVAPGATIGFPMSGASNEFSTIGSTFNSAAPIDIPAFFGELFFNWDTTTFIP